MDINSLFERFIIFFDCDGNCGRSVTDIGDSTFSFEFFLEGVRSLLGVLLVVLGFLFGSFGGFLLTIG
jgi:hypothetical protein